RHPALRAARAHPNRAGTRPGGGLARRDPQRRSGQNPRGSDPGRAGSRRRGHRRGVRRGRVRGRGLRGRRGTRRSRRTRPGALRTGLVVPLRPQPGEDLVVHPDIPVGHAGLHRVGQVLADAVRDRVVRGLPGELHAGAGSLVEAQLIGVDRALEADVRLRALGYSERLGPGRLAGTRRLLRSALLLLGASFPARPLGSPFSRRGESESPVTCSAVPRTVSAPAAPVSRTVLLVSSPTSSTASPAPRPTPSTAAPAPRPTPSTASPVSSTASPAPRPTSSTAPPAPSPTLSTAPPAPSPTLSTAPPAPSPTLSTAPPAPRPTSLTAPPAPSPTSLTAPPAP